MGIVAITNRNSHQNTNSEAKSDFLGIEIGACSHGTRQENKQCRADRANARKEKKQTEVDATQAALDILNAKDNSGNSSADYTPYIIGGVLIITLIAGFFLVKKMTKPKAVVVK